MTNTSIVDSGGRSSAPQSLLVTTDTKGRVRISKEQRRKILAQFEGIGLSGAQFAKIAGVKYSTLQGWLQRYGRSKPKSHKKELPRLLEAVVDSTAAPEPTGSNGVVVHLSGGLRLEISSLAQVPIAAALIHAVQPISQC